MATTMATPVRTGNERTYPRPASRYDFEIAIICALTREMDAVELLVDEFWTDGDDQTRYGKALGDPNTYELARIGNFNVVLVVLPSMGKIEATAAAHGVATSYPNISLVLVVGICGGMPVANVGGEREDIVLGDVVISSMLNQYDFGRQLPDRFLSKTEVENTFGRPNRDLRGLLKSLEKVRARKNFQRQVADNLVKLQGSSDRFSWRYTYPGTDKDRLFKASYEHKHHRLESGCLPCAQGSICESSWEISCDDLGCDATYLATRERAGQPNYPSVFIGRVGSADAVVRSAKHRDAHAAKGIIALEMEGAGVWDVFPCLVIKGVCDYADSHKNKGWQGYAAATAASATKAFLNHYQGKGKISRHAINNWATFDVNHSQYMTSPCTDLDAGKVARPGLDQSSSEATLDTRMGKCTEGGARSQDNPTLRNFIEQLLLPKLSSINRLMTLEIHSVTAALDTGFPYLAYNYAVDGSYRIGKGNASEDHTTFSMNQQEDNLWDDSWYQEARDYFKDIRRSPGQGATVWRYHKIESGDDAGHRFCKKTAHMQIWMYGDTITITRLYMLAGSNEIVYEGAQWTKFELWIEPGVLLTKENGKISVRSSWKITFTVQEAADGDLHISIQHVRPDPKFSGNYKTYEKLRPTESKLKEMYKCASNNFDNLAQSLRDYLDQQEKLVCLSPGSSTSNTP